MTNISSGIVLRGLEFPVFLGWPDAERAQQQLVVIDINLQFQQPPQGCVSDELQDTHCYDTLTATILEKISTRQYKLLEHLGHELYQHIKAFVKEGTTVGVRVKKLPPIASLKGGVFFHYGDENIVW
ncbi:MAG: dihydroneopterin aldolase [Pseudomonadota bacterium]